VFVNQGGAKLGSILLVLVGLWVPALINLSGIKNTGSFQVETTVLKFAALAFMSIVGLFYVDSANVTPWNVSGGSAISAGSVMAHVGAAMAWRTDRESVFSIGLFSNRLLLIGIAAEAAMVALLSYTPGLQQIFHTGPQTGEHQSPRPAAAIATG
jgi:amino acid transporter